MSEARFHPAPARSRRRKTHGASSEMPTTSPKTALSRCQPMPAAAPYSVTSTCWSCVGAMPANAAARAEREEEGRDVVRLAEQARGEVVVPAVRHHAALADAAVKLEVPERERAYVVE